MELSFYIRHPDWLVLKKKCSYLVELSTRGQKRNMELSFYIGHPDWLVFSEKSVFI